MADKGSADIFMYFVKDSTPLVGECQTELTPPGQRRHELLRGFDPKKMFEISRFSFGVGVEQEAIDQQEKQIEALFKATGQRPPKRPRPPVIPGQSASGNAVTVQPVTFTRPMDVASASLLFHTIKRTYFARVALVKRKSAGGRAAGEPYLRMDFRGVILTECSWSNDDPIEESYSFQAREITMRYRPQLEDGTLGAARVGFWSLKQGATEAALI